VAKIEGKSGDNFGGKMKEKYGENSFLERLEKRCGEVQDFEENSDGR
jgi:hypothetical protein